MRRTVSKPLAFAAVVAVVILLVTVGLWVNRPVSRALLSAAATALAQTGRGDAVESDDDTTKTAASTPSKTEEKTTDEAKETKAGGVNIRIDESGIRIEGDADEAGEADTTENRIIFDKKGWSRSGDHRRFKEKGADIVRFGEDVNIEADELVRGDVVVFGGDASIAGKVVGDVVVIVGSARVLTGAEINGDLVVIGGTIDEESEVIVHGERVVLKDLKISLRDLPFGFRHHPRPFDFLSTTAKFFISVILSFLVVLFLRGRVVRSHEHIVSGALKSLGTGFLVAFIGVFMIPVLFIILLVTIIGIPLALVLVASCIAVFFIADTVFVYALGSKVTEKLNIQTTNPFAFVLVGTAVLYLPALIGFGFSLLPFGGFLGGFFKVIGVLIGVFAFLAGLGALFLSRFGARGVPAPAAVPGPVTPQ
jgi:hypothetical protein